MKAIKISELNNYIKKYLAMDYLLTDILVVGEVSNLKYHSSGNTYFSLIDKNAKINCIFVDLEDTSPNLVEGMEIEVRGGVSFHELSGGISFIVKEINTLGQGDVYKNFLRVKEKLQGEGLFDSKYKKPLKKIPRSVGIITSITGAALQDILSVLQRRNPSCDILIYPVLVQGRDSVESLIAGIKTMDLKVDTIIIGRGGGSYEDLSSFNDEELARAIFSCTTPVISAVGHEVDFTICDFVADRRAATPSVAAEIVSINTSEILFAMENSLNRGKVLLEKQFSEYKRELFHLNSFLQRSGPIDRIENLRRKLERCSSSLRINFLSNYRMEKSNFNFLFKSLINRRPSNLVKNHRGNLQNLLSRLNYSLHTKLKSEKNGLDLNLEKLDRAINYRLHQENVNLQNIHSSKLVMPIKRYKNYKNLLVSIERKLNPHQQLVKLRWKMSLLNRDRKFLNSSMESILLKNQSLLDLQNRTLQEFEKDNLRMIVYSEDGKIIARTSDVEIGSRIKVSLVDGSLIAEVRGKE